MSRTNTEWIDEKHHRHEAANATQDSNPSMENLKCEKNGTHSDLIGLSDLTLEHIPADMRNNDMKQFVLEVSKLTVNITVQEKSPHRPNADYNNLGKKHFGSGTAFINGEDHSDTWMKQLNDENKTNCSLPATTSSERNNQGFYFTVTTNRHVVFDDLEAKSAVVEFFYDSADRKDVVRTHGVAIRHSKIFGEYKSYLLCKTSDREFVNWISTARQEVKYRIDKMQEDTKKMLEKNCFIIFHPHGLEKRMSFGRSVVVKYGLITNTSGAKESVYLENKDSLSETSDAYEVLMYNAPTCPGSSGSVVFTFRRKKESSGDPKFCPFLWVHTGVDRTTQLGVSSMEAVDPNTQIYNIEDPAPLSTIVTKLRESVTVTTETSKPTTTVVARSGTPPLYPQFFAVMKRLSSYDNVKYQSRCDHSPAELAIGGFFYTGTSPDCVRCFYCGLGLKAWRPGDDMYVEHQRARPNCGYLKLCMEFKATLNLDLLKEGSNIPVFPDKELTSTLTVSLLERENRLLKLQQFCRMCFRYKPGELFLPCGEVLVCDKCSEILSTCPSCNLKIEATVAVYMS